MAILLRLLRGAGFRLTLLYTLAFMVSVGLIGWLTHGAVTGALEGQAWDRLEAEAGALVDEFNHGGRPDLDAALAGRFVNPLVPHRYVLIGADGRVASGDATLAGRVDGGSRSLVGSFTPSPSVTRTLGDGSRIVIVDDLVGVREVETVLLRALLGALAAAAVLGLATGLVLSGMLLRRIDAVLRTAEAVVGGDIAHRIPTDESGDEFDRLAGTLNGMLDRIAGLLDNLRQVSSDVAHDLRTPLSRLRQGLEKADLHATTVEAFRGAVVRAIGEIDAILNIFSALLRIAQIEGGARRGAFRQVDLSALLLRVADAYAPSAEASGRSLTVQIIAGVEISGDPDLLVQLFANLIENGLQHTPAGTRLVLTLAATPEAARFRLDDDGPGIPESERQRVFQRFYRLDCSRSSAGNGLGLSLVAAVTELHGGVISLADNAPGLCVALVFPIRCLRSD